MPETIPVLVPMENVNDEAVILIRWLVADGDEVTKDEAIAEMETSKAVVEIVAPRAGMIEFTAHPGQEVAVGSSIANLTPAREFADQQHSAVIVHGKGALDFSPLNATPSTASSQEIPGVRFSKKALDLISSHRLSPELFSPSGMVREADVLAMLRANPVVTRSVDNDLHRAVRELSFDGVTLISHSCRSAEGMLDSEFLDEIRKNPEAFGKLPSTEKCEAYRKHGAAIGVDVEIGEGTVILTPQLVLRDGVRIGPQSHINCSEAFQVGSLSSFRQGLSVDGSTVVIGENVFGCSRIEISGGSKNPWSVLYVGDTTFIGDDAILDISRPIVIGKEVFVTQRSILITHNIGQSIFEGFENCFESIVLEDYCQIGMNSTIYAGSRIGSSAIIGSNSYVVSSVPPGKLAIGVPARVVRDSARKLSHHQQVQIALQIVRDFRELLTLKGVEVSDLPVDGFIVNHKGRNLLLRFVERYPGNSIVGHANDLTVILTLEATASATPGFAVFDLLKKNVSGEDDIFVDTTREFLRKRGIRCQPGAWRYGQGLI